jgi:hypothetical protein
MQTHLSSHDQTHQKAVIMCGLCIPARVVAAEGVLVVPVPACDLRLAQGVVPTPQLVGTLEALAQVSDSDGMLAVSAVVRTICHALKQDSGGGDSSSSSGGGGGGGGCSGGGNSSSTSSGGSNRSRSGSSSTPSDLLQGVFQALASLAGTGAVNVILVGSVSEAKEHARMSLMCARVAAWSAIAADLLRLAAHEVAAGRAGRATLALAAAAQRLAHQCANAAEKVLKGLEGVAADMSQGAAAAHRLDIQTALAEHTTSVFQHLQLVHQGLEALRGAVSCWQAVGLAGAPPQRQQQQQQEEHQQREQEQAQQEQLEQQQHEVHERKLLKLEQQQLEIDSMQARLAQRQHMLQQAKQQQSPALEGQVQDLQQQIIAMSHAALQQQADLGSLREELCLSRGKDMVIKHLRSNVAARRLAVSIRHTAHCRLQLSGCGYFKCLLQHKAYSTDSAVAGLRGVRCGGCGLARYCCPQHQKEDWPRHRQVCRRLAQARAAAAGAAGGGDSGSGSN